MNENFLRLVGLSSAYPGALHLYLLAAAVLFVLGVTACIIRRNAIGVLIGIELILNAAIINFMAFWRYRGGLETDPDMSGPMMGVFMIILAACEAAIALAILLNLYFNVGSVEVDKVHQMKH